MKSIGVHWMKERSQSWSLSLMTMLGGIPNPTMKFLNYYIFNDENRRKCWEFIERMEVRLLRRTSRIERWKKLHANDQVNNE